MSKITKEIRDRIRNKGVDSAFAARVEAWKKADVKLAIECYNFDFPKKTRDLVAMVVVASLFRTFFRGSPASSPQAVEVRR
jgi:hypothetical protein